MYTAHACLPAWAKRSEMGMGGDDQGQTTHAVDQPETNLDTYTYGRVLPFCPQRVRGQNIIIKSLPKGIDITKYITKDIP